MKPIPWGKITIVTALVLAIVGVIMLKIAHPTQHHTPVASLPSTEQTVVTTPAQTASDPSQTLAPVPTAAAPSQSPAPASTAADPSQMPTPAPTSATPVNTPTTPPSTTVTITVTIPTNSQPVITVPNTAVSVQPQIPATPAITPGTTTPYSSTAHNAMQPATPKTKRAIPPVTAAPKPAVKPRSVKTTTPAVAVRPRVLPKFIELGSDKCVPCKMMQTVLAQLRRDYASQLSVQFIDVWKDEATARPYNVRTIPTQVILDGSGKEVLRHTGYWPVDEAVSKLRKLGLLK